MRKLLFLFLLSPILGFSQSPDGTFKTITATMPTADNYVISEPLPAAYDPKEKFIVVFPSANTTTSPTLNRNSLGTKAIKNDDGTSPAIGAICACRKLLSYNGTYFQIVGGSGAGAGITNTAANNEIPKSDGTNIGPSGLFSASNGNLNLGNGSLAGDRVLTTVGSGTNSSFTLNTQGAGSFWQLKINNTYLLSGNFLNYDAITNRQAVSLGSSASLYVANYTSSTIPGGIRSFSGSHLLIQTEATSGGTSSGNLWFKTGDSYASGNSNSGHIILNTGTKNSIGTRGNISIFDDTGSFGSGQQVTFIHDAVANPSGSPTAGFIIYSDAGNSSHPTVKLPSGTIVDLTAGSGGTVTSIATTSPITGGTITTTGTIACATCVTSASSLTSNSLMIGGGGQASSTTTTGTGVLTALGVNTGSAGSFVVNGGALGTPSSGVATNLTGLPISTGLTGGGTNRVPYFTSSTALATTSTFLFDGTNLGVGATPDAILTISKQTTIVAPISGSVAHYIGLDANPLRITYDTHNNANASGTALMFRRSRGTAGTPLALSANDDLGSFNTRGYGATGYASASTGLLSFKANQTFTDANMGTYASIYTTPQ